MRPIHGLRTRLHRGGAIAVACLPEVRKEPAVQQVRRLGQEAEFASAQAAFEQGSNSTVPTMTQVDDSDTPKPVAAA